MTIERVFVAGAGLMGHGIAQVHAAIGKQVTAVRARPCAGGGRSRPDRREPRAVGRQGSAGCGGTRCDARPADADRPTPASAADADLVIEAVFEDLRVKTALWRELDALAQPAAIFATNTSSIAIRRLAEAVSGERRQRFVGMHFFSPVPVMPLVELIRSGGHDRRDGRRRSARSRRSSASRSSSRPTGRVSSSTASSCRSSPSRCVRSSRASGPPRTSMPAPGSASTTRWGRSSWPTSSASTSCSGSCACSRTGSGSSTCARRACWSSWSMPGTSGQKTGQGFYTYPRESG